MLTSRILSCIMVLPNKKGVVNEMNAEIAKHYLSMPSKNYCLNNLPENSNPKDIVQLLNNAFGNNWAWTIDSEQMIESNLITIVTLYIPGRLCTGRSVTLSKGMVMIGLATLRTTNVSGAVSPA